MEKRKLGNTDIDVSSICLGTMTWGQQNTQDEGFEQMDYAIDMGINFFDTAEMYAVPPKKKLKDQLKKLLVIGLVKEKIEIKLFLPLKYVVELHLPGLEMMKYQLNKLKNKFSKQLIKV